MAILGAGPAGLAVGYYAAKAGIDFRLLEAADEVGGMCRTMWRGPFGFDCGAHRFHTKDAEITREVRELLGEDLRYVASPSQVCLSGTLVDFPLSPLDLLRKLGPVSSIAAAASLLRQRCRARSAPRSLEDLAVRRYGAPVARRFLLDYSEKLWGLPASELSPAVAGARLRGLDLRTFLVESFAGRRAKTRHLDGSFLYPRRGFGQIVERLADACGRDRIATGSSVSGLRHDGRRIVAVEVGEGSRVAVERVVSTLPIGILVRLLAPAPPPEVLRLAASLRFRSLALVVLFLDRPSVTANASVYFPGAEVPFTRLYEPKNRSAELAPERQTAVVAEIPHDPGAAIGAMSDADLRERTARTLAEMDWIELDEIIDSTVVRLPCAYPVLDCEIDDRLRPVTEYVSAFENLHLAGRSSRFRYTHLHDLMAEGRDVIAAIATSADERVAGDPVTEAVMGVAATSV